MEANPHIAPTPPGLSVLIPLYNVDARDLVCDLLAQLRSCRIKYEVLVYNDASPQQNPDWQFLQDIKSPALLLKRMPTNIGRSAIRNLLAKDSRYSHLLFIDADSGLPDETYIQHYLMYWQDYDAIVGGTIYEEKCPSPAVMLRWVYGRRREQISADLRNRAKHASITLNNLLIKRSVFLATGLDEQIRTYGHEDTKLGYALDMARATVHHIQNPVIHLGLEPSPEYLEKVKAAVQNFYDLSVHQGIGLDTRLHSTFKRFDGHFLGWFLRVFFAVFGWYVRLNLLSRQPSLWLLDAYKLELMLKHSRADRRKSKT